MRFAVGHADEHKTSAANVSCRWMDDREGKSRGDGGVNGVAAGVHDVDSDLGGEAVHADYHGMLRWDRLGRGARPGCENHEQQGDPESLWTSHERAETE